MDAVHRMGKDDVAEIAELLVSELVTNAVLHAGTVVRLRVLGDGARVRIEVSDGINAPPSRRRYSAEAATGRGLGLVEALAAEWGTRSDVAGKTVWCTVGAGA